jgi:hypothetical protein
MEKLLDLAAILLGFNKCMNLVEGSDGSSYCHGEGVFQRQAAYSVNFPIYFNTVGGNSAPVSDLM